MSTKGDVGEGSVTRPAIVAEEEKDDQEVEEVSGEEVVLSDD